MLSNKIGIFYSIESFIRPIFFWLDQKSDSTKFSDSTKNMIQLNILDLTTKQLFPNWLDYIWLDQYGQFTVRFLSSGTLPIKKTPISKFDFLNSVFTRGEEEQPIMVLQFDLLYIWRSEIETPLTGLKANFQLRIKNHRSVYYSLL